MIDERNARLHERHPEVTVMSRIARGNTAILSLSNGKRIKERRFIPIGKHDRVRQNDGNILVHARNDNVWINVGRPWTRTIEWFVAGIATKVIFKEIESEREFALFDNLRKFHYRGGGGAGRTVPLIAISSTWDLPEVLGFIEISSSMIANTARKKFFNYPYREQSGYGWTEWDRAATKRYSNFVARISRFVIHPEIRGLGLARHFLDAAMQYAKERWHYGGYKPRFLEITADMLRYYRFVSDEFIYLGETEGNEHRLAKDMTYLVRKALSSDGAKGMPQGGGGIMTMQRAYASQLIDYMESHDRQLGEVIDTLQYDPEHLDQETWEALYRLNRRPKPCYAAGLTIEASEYLQIRAHMVHNRPTHVGTKRRDTPKKYSFFDIRVSVSSEVTQSNASRRIQDAFGFVGSTIEAQIVQPTCFEVEAGTITMICGASGSGKSLLGRAVRTLCSGTALEKAGTTDKFVARFEMGGEVEPPAHVVEIEPLNHDKVPLEQFSNVNLNRFIEICAYCGLAEPQLFVRPVTTLSSGQQYRLQMALAFLRCPDILYVDNFCESLDRYTAAAVCRGLRLLASNLEVGVLVSTAAYERFLGVLSPSQVILLRRGNAAVVRQLTGGVAHEV